MPWEQIDRDKWFQKQSIQRSYTDLVLKKLKPLEGKFEVIQYGALSIDPVKYPLFMLRTKQPQASKPTVLITGGVHGYETSGVLGAIAFMQDLAFKYQPEFSFVCFPCLSPWAFETINRWNNKAVDPNRSFFSGSPSEECQFFIDAIFRYKMAPLVHFDLHETTDTDNTIFRPALAARDGLDLPFEEIPDGFYLVGAEDKPQPAFQKAIIDSVRPVTHIAAPDSNGEIIGKPVQQEGIINYPASKLKFCVGVTDAPYVTTTEVYPDSPRVTPQNCIDAQIAAICGGLDFLKTRLL